MRTLKGTLRHASNSLFCLMTLNDAKSVTYSCTSPSIIIQAEFASGKRNSTIHLLLYLGIITQTKTEDPNKKVINSNIAFLCKFVWPGASLNDRLD